MKKALLLLSIIFLQLCSFAQENENGTTLDEYTYITKGYEMQVGAGLEMKKGYELKKIYGDKEKGREIVFYELLKENKRRAVMAEFTWTNGKKNYLCIPNYGSEKEVNENCRADIEKIFTPMPQVLTFYTYSLYNLFAKYNK